ncbi:uncharacterized protein Tco025E_05784 [Trypanosoma conorhini]|uniref:Uncharacterized protein n=1 Tax=Trypanosoma conorhini TaxID=83891 RepID=A0A422PAH4_9TRYP|nr:uncharacterized protein Tco025E_05784 [Trypanosoma conorhini]RNF14703.1 hypothetical protein Tco025E_05784 [Trypanosoma conorhini]
MPGEPWSTNFSEDQTPVTRDSPVAVNPAPNVASAGFSDDSLYGGPLLDGKPEGHGICLFPSGTICSGKFERGFLEGPAEVLLPSGALFTGNFTRSVANGSGACMQHGRLMRGTWCEGVVVEQTEEDLGCGSRAKLFTSIAGRLYAELRNLTTKTKAPDLHHPYHRCRIMEPIVHLCEQQSFERDPMVPSKEALDYFVLNPAVTKAVPPALLTAGTAATPGGSSSDTEGSFVGRTVRRQTKNVEVHMQDKPVNRNLLTMGASPYAVFACAGPAANEIFSFSRYVKYFLIFLVPFLSLPQLPFSPIRKARLEMEREFVVSGASLLREHDPPFLSLHFVTVAICCNITAVVIVAAKVTLGHVSGGHLSLAEVVVPCVFWVVQAMLFAAYNSYMRVAHALERLERRLTPHISAFAAGLVDNKAKVCIYTWDENGRALVKNKHYRYRWLACSIVVGLVMGFSAPCTRVGFGHPMFGTEKYDVAAAVLFFASNLLFSTVVAYYVLKITDMQRQILEQMRVITRLAYLEGRSLMRPSEFLKQRFNFDEPLNPYDVLTGVVGWCVVRSLVLYASTCSNHASRGSTMSIYLTLVFCGFLVTIGDIVYVLVVGYSHSGANYSLGHTYAFVLCTLWGFMLQRYLYICVGTLKEHTTHLYLLDVACLYHRLRHRPNDESSDAIATCHQMIKAHDELPSIFSVRISPLMLVVMVFIHLLALVAISMNLCIAINYPKPHHL